MLNNLDLYACQVGAEIAGESAGDGEEKIALLHEARLILKDKGLYALALFLERSRDKTLKYRIIRLLKDRNLFTWSAFDQEGSLLEMLKSQRRNRKGMPIPPIASAMQDLLYVSGILDRILSYAIYISRAKRKVGF